MEGGRCSRRTSTNGAALANGMTADGGAGSAAYGAWGRWRVVPRYGPAAAPSGRAAQCWFVTASRSAVPGTTASISRQARPALISCPGTCPGTRLHGKSRRNAKPTVTAGLKCAPDTAPVARMIAITVKPGASALAAWLGSPSATVASPSPPAEEARGRTSRLPPTRAGARSGRARSRRAAMARLVRTVSRPYGSASSRHHVDTTEPRRSLREAESWTQLRSAEVLSAYRQPEPVSSRCACSSCSS